MVSVFIVEDDEGLQVFYKQVLPTFITKHFYRPTHFVNFDYSGKAHTPPSISSGPPRFLKPFIPYPKKNFKNLVYLFWISQM